MNIYIPYINLSNPFFFFFDNKMSIFEEYGTFKMHNIQDHLIQTATIFFGVGY